LWIETSDVEVDVTTLGVDIRVSGEMERLRRTFWRDLVGG